MKNFAKFQVATLMVAAMFVATASIAQVVGSQTATAVGTATFCKVMDIQLNNDAPAFKVGDGTVANAMNEWANGVVSTTTSQAKVNATCDWRVDVQANQPYWTPQGAGTTNLQTRYLEYKTNTADADVTYVTHPSWKVVKPSSAASGNLAAKGNRGINRMFNVKWAIGKRYASALPSLLDRGVTADVYDMSVNFVLSEQ